MHSINFWSSLHIQKSKIANMLEAKATIQEVCSALVHKLKSASSMRQPHLATKHSIPTNLPKPVIPTSAPYNTLPTNQDGRVT